MICIARCAAQVTNTGNVTELLPQSQHQLAQLQQAPHAEDAGQGPAGSTASPDGTASAAPPHGLGPEDVHLSEHPHAPERASPAHQRAFASVGGHGPTSVTPQRSTTSGGAAAPGRTPSSINRSAIPVPRVDVTPSPAASTPPYSKASSSRLPRPGSIAGASPTPATPAVASASATSPGSRIPPGSASPPGAGFSPSGGTGVSPPAAPAQDGRLSATHLNSGAAQIGMGHNVAGAAMAGGAGGGVAAAAERASRGGSHSSSSVAAAPSSNTGVPGSSSLGSSSGGGPDGRQRTNSSGGVAAAAPAAARGGAGHVPVAVRTDSEALMPPPGADPDPDLLSPDADQLAAWAMEAANALAAGPGAGAEAGEGGAKQLNDGPSGGGGGGGLLMSQANGVSALPRPDPSPKWVHRRRGRWWPHFAHILQCNAATLDSLLCYTRCPIFRGIGAASCWLRVTTMPRLENCQYIYRMRSRTAKHNSMHASSACVFLSQHAACSVVYSRQGRRVAAPPLPASCSENPSRSLSCELLMPCTDPLHPPTSPAPPYPGAAAAFPPSGPPAEASPQAAYGPAGAAAASRCLGPARSSRRRGNKRTPFSAFIENSYSSWTS